MNRFVFLIIANLCVINLNAQHISRMHYVCDNKTSSIDFFEPVGAVVLRGQGVLPDQAEIIAAGQSNRLSRDEHVVSIDSIWTSNLIVFEPSVNDIEIKGLIEGNTYELISIRLPSADHQGLIRTPSNDCSQPSMILQSEWRAGLPPPDYERIFNNVNNLIIHHSATANTLTDYTALVRSIYTYHTGVNGWSDIGYNYLIAPDGTIFAGRDPGNDMETHQVLGAHFCASNTGTMGICLLGTYMNDSPSDEMLASLIRLISWKSALDSIPPLTTHPHPLHPALPVIAGHRDGCSTLCPGDVVYNNLQAYRNQTQDYLVSCGVFLNIRNDVPNQNSIRLKPNPVIGNEIGISTPATLKSAAVFDMNGRSFSLYFNDECNQLLIPPSLPTGMYILQLSFETEIHWIKFVRL